jgi:hypothetical protein
MTRPAPLPLWLAPVGFLLAAVYYAHLPYGYYIFLRITVCSCAAYIAYAGFRDGKLWWPTAFALTAVLFNPVIPVNLRRDIWHDIDWIVALGFSIHVAFLRLAVWSYVARATKTIIEWLRGSFDSGEPRWRGLLGSALGVAFLIGAATLLYISGRPAPKPPPPPGWSEIANCTPMQAFANGVTLQLFEDHSVVYSIGKDKVTATWSYSAQHKYAIGGPHGEETEFTLVQPWEDYAHCLLIKGDQKAADLTESWKSEESSDYDYPDRD